MMLTAKTGFVLAATLVAGCATTPTKKHLNAGPYVNGYVNGFAIDGNVRPAEAPREAGWGRDPDEARQAAEMERERREQEQERQDQQQQRESDRAANGGDHCLSCP